MNPRTPRTPQTPQPRTGTRCWVIVPRRDDEDGYGDPHYPDRAAAAGDLDPQQPQQFPVPLPQPCYVHTCDSCGAELEDLDTGVVIHWRRQVDAEDYALTHAADVDAVATAEGTGWSSDGRRWHCTDCPQLNDTDQLAELARRPGPADLMIPGLHLTRADVAVLGPLGCIPDPSPAPATPPGDSPTAPTHEGA